jgi:lysine 6-dehydrogenase
MTHVTIVGAGEMGRATLGVLLRQLPEATFTVVDRSPQSLERAKEITGERAHYLEMDAAAQEVDLAGSDLVLNLAGPFYGGSDTTARAALSAGCQYVDICDDIEGARPILDLDSDAVAAGAVLVTGAGGSPGIANLLAKRLLEVHPETDGIRVVWVTNEADPGGLAPLRHMLFMTVMPCPIWQDGKFTTSPGFVPSTAREHDLPGVGKVTAFDTSHPETLTLPRQFPDLRHVSVQGSLWPAWANEAFSAFGRIGFGYPDIRVEVEGVEVDPVEVLWKVLWERHTRRHGDRRTGFGALQVQALTGEAVIASFSMFDPHSMMRQTSIGAAGIAMAVLSDPPPPGAYGSEVLDAEKTLASILSIAESEEAFPNGFQHSATGNGTQEQLQ